MTAVKSPKVNSVLNFGSQDSKARKRVEENDMEYLMCKQVLSEKMLK